MKNARSRLALFALIALTVMAFALQATALAFPDVGDHWGKDWIVYGVDNGYLNGYPDGTFKPDAPVTRAEFAAIINRALGITGRDDADFTDVDKDEWYAADVERAVYAGLINGYEDGSFRPDNHISREEAAAVLSRLVTPAVEKGDVSVFKDASDIDDWAKDAVAAVTAKKLFGGDQFGMITPKGELTRAEAAKLLAVVRENETVVNGAYRVSTDDALVSRVLFTDDVTVDTETAKAATLEGCRILGTLRVEGDRAADVTVDDTVCAMALLASPDTTLEVTESASVRYIVVEQPAVLKGNGLATVFLSGSALVGGVTEFESSVENLRVTADAVVRAGTVGTLTVADKASLTLQSGKVQTMTLSEGAAGSVITLSGDTSVDSLTVNAPGAFMGKGRIQNAAVNADGVTFTTTPEKVTGRKIAEGDDPDPTPSGDEFRLSASSPADGASNVSSSADITLLYNAVLYDKDGAKLTTSYVQKNISLRRSTRTGTAVDFDAALVSGGRSIAITPNDDLSAGSRYYVVIPAGVFTKSDGTANAAETVAFTTRDTASSGSTGTVTGKITFSPTSTSAKVSVKPTIKITFPSAIQTYDKEAVTTRYLSSEAIELRVKSASGTKIDATAAVDSTRKVVTVTPDEPLEPDTRYYVIVTAGSLRYTSGGAISRTYDYFTTADELSYTVTPASGATNVSVEDEIVFTFNSEIYRPSGSNLTSAYLRDSVFELHRSSASGAQVEFTAVFGSDKKTVRLIPSGLEPGTRYYAIMQAGKVATASGTENAKATVSFTTAAAMSPAITPANGAEDVSVASDVVIRFTESLYDKQKAPLTAETAASAITFKRGSSSGTNVPFTASVNAAGDTITLTPDATLSASTKYYVAVARNAYYNENGKTNTASSVTFTTGVSDAPDFLPYNGEKKVPVNTAIDVTFEQKMFTSAGAALSTTYVKNNVVELYREDTGAAVPFNVKLSSDGRTITVTPTSSLAGETVYTVVIRRYSLQNAAGTRCERYASSFTTEEKISTTYTITPAKSATGVALTASVTVTFESGVYRVGGGPLTAAYAAESAVELRKNAANGDIVAITATVSEDRKTLTVKPLAALEANTLYYVVVRGKTMEFSDGTAVPEKSSTFRTGDGKPVVSAFTVDGAGADSVTMTVTSTTDGYAYFSAVNDKDKSIRVDSDGVAVTANEPKTYVLNGLSGNTAYTASVYIDNAGNKSNAKALTFRTAVPAALAVGEVTDKTAEITVTAGAAGSLTFTYTAKGGETVERVSGLAMTAGTKRTFSLSDLKPQTAYTVKITFTDASGVDFSLSDTFTTEAEKVENLAVTGITVTTSEGDTYNASVKDGKAAVTVEKAAWVKIAVNSSVENATVTVGDKTLKPGAQSDQIPTSPDAPTEIPLTLTSSITGNQTSVTLTVTVA